MSSGNSQIGVLLQDLDRVKRRQKICKKAINENINNIINTLQNSINEITNDNTMEEENDDKLKDKLQSLSSEVLKMKPLDNVTKSHKEYFAYLSKLGKDIDKTFNKDIDKLFKDNKLDNTQVNNVIQEHYLREGKFDIESAFKQEIGLDSNATTEGNFLLIHKIIEDVKNKNIDAAISWALANESALEQIESDLIFTLYQQKFINELHTKGQQEAVNFARTHLTRFFPKYAPEMQRLMGSLAYSKAPENARYSDIYGDNKWEKTAAQVLQDACKIYHTTPQSPLYQVLSAGTLALPKFLKYYSLSQHNKPDWNSCEELPVATDLGKDYQFHSIFVCPVTKEISTPDNPPMLLNCGHVISEHALKKILSGNRTRFKCPYCPAEISAVSSKKIYLN